MSFHFFLFFFNSKVDSILFLSNFFFSQDRFDLIKSFEIWILQILRISLSTRNISFKYRPIDVDQTRSCDRANTAWTKKRKKERNELPMACFRRAKKSDSTFCDKSSLVPLLLLLYSCLVSSNRKLYHRRGDTICPSIEKRGSKLARNCNDNENIFRYREGRGIVKSKIA